MRLDFNQEDLTSLAQALAPVLIKELRSLLQARGTGQDGDTIFTVETLSEYLHVPKSKIYELTHLKSIPYFKVGKFPRFRKVDIDSWLRETYTPALDGSLNLNKGRVKICQG
ncbi:MAG: excisionase family DNA-binding protein [Candidatus Brocadiales bacterium]|nr:excisionase family DNA-binding protein [Candidatus Brocadiales bacterium]